MRKPILTLAAALSVASLMSMDVEAQSGRWNGFYAGVHGAYIDTETSYANPTTPHQYFRGPMAGAQIGYNYQMGRWVLGAEADVAFGGIDDFVRDGNFLTFDGKLEAMGTVRARLGYDFDGFMPYITAGLMWNRLAQGSACPAGATRGSVCFVTGPYDVSSTETFQGFTWGFGAEYALTRNWSLKAEVLFADLGKEDYTATIPVAGTVTAPVWQDLDYVARAGINYRFLILVPSRPSADHC